MHKKIFEMEEKERTINQQRNRSLKLDESEIVLRGTTKKQPQKLMPTNKYAAKQKFQLKLCVSALYRNMSHPLFS
jgi:hypothetical protein